jgi:hypothetical protein
VLTGTPLDFTVIPELLAWLGKVIPVAWLLLLVGSVAFVWRRASTILRRAMGLAAVLAFLVVAPLWMFNELREQSLAERAKQEAQQAEFKGRYARAEALFKKRCETAGEFINKTVPDVKGLVWMKWREPPANPDDQFRMDDPFGHDCSRDACFKELLVATEGSALPYQGEYLFPYGKGYQFVEALDPSDGRLYRYRLRLYRPRDRDATWSADDVRSELIKEPIAKASARFGLTWDDISTPEDRENWVAGGSLSVVDLETNDLVAKRVGYMMDPGLGSREGFRSPWGFAGDHACPPRVDETGKRTEVGFTRRFLFKVAQPAKGG